MVGIAKIAVELGIDLEKAKVTSKQGWKDQVKKKIVEKTRGYLEDEMKQCNKYASNVEDQIAVGGKKRYTNLTQKKAKVWFRMRAGIADPSPRRPYHPISKWKCKLCPTMDQSTEHYIKFCPGTAQAFNGRNRTDVYRFIQKMDGNDEYLHQVTIILEKIYKQIND